MVNGVAAVTALDVTATTQVGGAQPTAQQAERFENQLYSAPLDSAQGLSGDFRSLMDFASSLSSSFREQLERPAAGFDVEQWPELKVLQDASREMRNLNLTTVQFQFVAAGVEITNRNAQTLFQQG